MRQRHTLFANIDAVDEETLRKLRHDLRSPLVVIAGFAQLLSGDREITETERRDYADRILRASQEMEQLMTDALG
ncbi:MAG: His Kinase (phospho-acceptor) domain [Solirubrobacteraceae bacterium]|nr:His Kinase (phospho-acceptor) domain [Solirubrobacteraceae bacterium]